MSPSEVYEALVKYYEIDGNTYDRERVHRIGLADDGRLEVVYSRPECDETIGLRIRIDLSRDDETARIVAGHLGEPLGSFMESLQFDENGVGWWDGEPIEWWYS